MKIISVIDQSDKNVPKYLAVTNHIYQKILQQGKADVDLVEGKNILVTATVDEYGFIEYTSTVIKETKFQKLKNKLKTIKSNIMKKVKYYDLSAVVKWIFIIAVILFLIQALQGCGKPIRATKSIRVQCPTYDEYYHWMKPSKVRRMNPASCPLEIKSKKNRRRAGLTPLGR